METRGFLWKLLSKIIAAFRAFWVGSWKLLRSGLRSTEFRETLRWCIPALILGFALRALLTWSMPWGYFQFDSMDFVYTAARYLQHGEFVIASKRTFLVPTLYCVPFLLHLPALIFIPLLQHLLGLLQIVLVGLLVRLWFQYWRWAIIPVTLWLAICPWNLWFEHALMSEALTMFSLFVVVLVGTLWVKTARSELFVWLLISLLLAAGARGETRLYFLFAGVLLVVSFWKNWKSLLPYAGGLLFIGLIAKIICKSSSAAPVYLLAGLIQLAPDHFYSLPKAEPFFLPLRDLYRPVWTEFPADTVQVAKQINKATDGYLHSLFPNAEKGKITDLSGPAMNRLSLEILLDHPLPVLSYPIIKTQIATDSWVASPLDQNFLHVKQKYAFRRGGKLLPALTRGLFGYPLDQAQLHTFIDTHYHPHRTAWYDRYAAAWNRAIIAFRLPDRPSPQRRWVHDYVGGVPGELDVMPGWPLFYPLALAGLLAGLIRKHPLRASIAGWGIVMLLVWYAAQMVGNTTPRYRFAYEPFLWLYVVLLFDVVISFATKWRRTPASSPTKHAVA